MSSGVQVRRITSGGWQILRQLRIAALSDAPDAFGQPVTTAAAQPDWEWMSAARAASEGDRRAWFVAWHEDRPVGLVQARRRPPEDCLVFSMWVSPDARRAGVGRALLQSVDEWAAGWGARKIVLWVVAGNDVAARFYERIGFTVLRDGPDAESGAAHGAFAMARPIERQVAGAAQARLEEGAGAA